MGQMIQKHKKKGSLAVLLAVALVATMILSFGGQVVRADETYTLNVTGGSTDIISDLGQADMQVDLYQIATGEKDARYDTWHWTLTEDYKSLADGIRPIDEETGQIIDDSFFNDDYNELANAAAKLALEKKLPVTQSKTAVSGVSDFGKIDAGPGLYVIVPRDREQMEAGTDVTSEGDYVYTIVNTTYWTYKFAPAVTAIPSKEANEDGEIGTAADFGPWLNDVEVVLKPSWTEREGQIKIIKNLLHYETKNPVSFVFSVEAVKDGKNVYSDVISMSFGDDTKDPSTRTNPGYDERIIGGLPVGAEVTVKEIYPDPNNPNSYYKLVATDFPDVPVVTAKEIIEFSFTNDYNDRYHGGGGAENQYVFTEDGLSPHWDTHQVINGQDVTDNSDGQSESKE